MYIYMYIHIALHIVGIGCTEIATKFCISGRTGPVREDVLVESQLSHNETCWRVRPGYPKMDGLYNLTNMDDWGVPLVQEICLCIYLYQLYYVVKSVCIQFTTWYIDVERCEGDVCLTMKNHGWVNISQSSNRHRKFTSNRDSGDNHHGDDGQFLGDPH